MRVRVAVAGLAPNVVVVLGLGVHLHALVAGVGPVLIVLAMALQKKKGFNKKDSTEMFLETSLKAMNELRSFQVLNF